MKTYIKTVHVHNAAEMLTEKLKEKIEPGQRLTLVGLNRGGIIPLGYMSYFLDCRNTKLLDITLYQNEKPKMNVKKEIKETSKNLEWINYLSENDTVIFIDDLIDTGSTFKVIEKALEKVNVNCKIIFATLFGNEDKVISGYRKPDGWLVFPWDENKIIND